MLCREDGGGAIAFYLGIGLEPVTGGRLRVYHGFHESSEVAFAISGKDRQRLKIGKD